MAVVSRSPVHQTDLGPGVEPGRCPPTRGGPQVWGGYSIPEVASIRPRLSRGEQETGTDHRPAFACRIRRCPGLNLPRRGANHQLAAEPLTRHDPIPAFADNAGGRMSVTPFVNTSPRPRPATLRLAVLRERPCFRTAPPAKDTRRPGQNLSVGIGVRPFGRALALLHPAVRLSRRSAIASQRCPPSFPPPSCDRRRAPRPTGLSTHRTRHGPFGAPRSPPRHQSV